jgi:phosphatidylglycerophosphatase A
MATRRHKVFNLSIILIPWLSMLFLGKRNLRRYSLAGVFIVIFEIINHLYGHKRNWWKFYDKRKSFIRDELPFSVGPYMPLSMWILKYSYGNFKKYVLLNMISDGLFAFLFIDILKKFKIISLGRLNHLQFFVYLHYKAYILYGIQYLFEKIKRYTLFY